jgi:hypothetical protein
VKMAFAFRGLRECQRKLRYRSRGCGRQSGLQYCRSCLQHGFSRFGGCVEFAAWIVVGNLAGFVTVHTLTRLPRFLAPAAGVPVAASLKVLGVKLVAAGLRFHAPIAPLLGIGDLCIAARIAVIGAR